MSTGLISTLNDTASLSRDLGRKDLHGSRLNLTPKNADLAANRTRAF
jgi:hypothetical protein